MIDPSLSNSLVYLADRISVEHDGTRAAIKRDVEHAIVAGELLIEVKERLQHGQWICGSETTAACRSARPALSGSRGSRAAIDTGAVLKMRRIR